ncbi:MAG: hypothetical protein PWP04_916 [Candidatus Atribacteria bacterium]|nr:hypothetical protein [Candidatus Atribacteria bacterium]
MEHRDRVLKTLNHIEPDRPPFDFEARSEVVNKLLDFLRLSEEEDLLLYLDIDFRREGMGPGGAFLERGAFFHPRRKWVIEVSPGIFEDEFGIRYRTDEEGRYFGFVYHPLEKDEDLEHYQFPDPGDPARYESLQKTIVSYKNKFFIQGEATLTFFEQAWQMSGYEHFIYNLYQNPAWVEKLLDKLLEFRLVQCRRYVELGVDIVWLGDDFGMQDRMMINPELWRKFFKPRMKLLIDGYKNLNPRVFTQYHSDGYIEPIIGDLIEVGIDILNPVQPESMDLKRIKKLYGDKLTLHGTISVQSLLPFSSLEELKSRVKEIIEICSPGGGYIMAPTHAIQADTPLENILAVYETGKILL